MRRAGRRRDALGMANAQARRQEDQAERGGKTETCLMACILAGQEGTVVDSCVHPASFPEDQILKIKIKIIAILAHRRCDDNW
jgi:hypothetical protein